MNIGIPKERRPFEFRVGLPPAGVEILVHHGHKVFVERDGKLWMRTLAHGSCIHRTRCSVARICC